MEWWTALSPTEQANITSILTGAAGDLVAAVTQHVWRTGRTHQRRELESPEKQVALQRAVRWALRYVLMTADFPNNPRDYDLHFAEWLESPLVAQEFGKLFYPRPDNLLDLELLREEFEEATGLDAAELDPPFDEMIGGMVQVFYLAANEETTLRDALNVTLLEALARQMGGLVHLAAQQVAVSERSHQQLTSINKNIERLHALIAGQDDAPTLEELARLERIYCNTLIDLFEKLTFKGIAPSGTPISLPLEKVYVELQAVGNVPDAADTYSATERRIMYEAEMAGELDDVRHELDALRAERWNKEMRRRENEQNRLVRQSIHATLRGLLTDMRGKESWPNRLQVAEILVNNRDIELDRRAIDVALEALDFATQPWYYLPKLGREVRSQAARILGQLDPLYHEERIFERLARVLDEDEDESVRDAAYGALLRLAAAPKRGAVNGGQWQ